MEKIMQRNIWIFAILFALSTLVFAAGSGGHEGAHDESIPFGKIGIQAINLGILLFVLFYFAKKPVVQAFAKKRQDFQEQSLKTERALKAAEKNLSEAREKLKTLELGEAGSISSANHEAEATKQKMITDAESQATRLKTDVGMVVQAEVNKSRADIREQIISTSITNAESAIFNSSASITQKSESGFLNDLGQVKA